MVINLVLVFKYYRAKLTTMFCIVQYYSMNGKLSGMSG